MTIKECLQLVLFFWPAETGASNSGKSPPAEQDVSIEREYAKQADAELSQLLGISKKTTLNAFLSK